MKNISNRPVIGLLVVVISTYIINMFRGNDTSVLTIIVVSFMSYYTCEIFDMVIVVDKYFKSTKANIAMVLVLATCCIVCMLISINSVYVIQTIAHCICVTSFLFATLYLSRAINYGALSKGVRSK